MRLNILGAKAPLAVAQICLLLSTLASCRPYVKTPDMMTPSIDARQASGGYWMESIQRQGIAAYNDDKSYKVFRNVKDYGAKGDGVTDDSAAINKAISEGNRCGTGDCDSSTITPAIIYFPAGTYVLNSPLLMYYYTAMIGDATNLPRLQGSANFNFENALALLDADPYIPGGWGAGWFTNQNNFYRQIRNLIIDMTQMPEAGPYGQEVNGIHWQVAQACSMQNVVFDMKPATPTSKQRGIMMENGSGMFMSDVVFNGGNVGAFLGSQQFTTRNFTFNGCNTAIELEWNWLWTFKSLDIQNCQVGLNMSSSNPVNETVGSAIIMDSKISASTAGIVTSYSSNSQPETGSSLLVHNVDFTGSTNAIVDGRTGSTILQGNTKVAGWGQGNTYIPGGQPAKREPEPENVGSGSASPASDAPNPVVTVTSTIYQSPLPATGSSAATSIATGTSPASASSAPFPTGNSTVRPEASQCTDSAVIPTMSKLVQKTLSQAAMPSSLLQADGSVFERSKPQYIGTPVSSFQSVKGFGAKGDGVTDDTDAIQKAMDSVTTDQILYFDHGAYVITKTVNVPANVKIVGEIWPLIMIKGDFFSDQNSPQPGFRVGKAGDKGNVEISDMIFETVGPVPGAIMMEWNVQESSQGSVGMWDTHFRVGGSAGTELQLEQCRALSSKTFKPECAASFMMMHITQEASAYFENTWFWVADHDLDMGIQKPLPPANETQISIYNGRGVFIESQGPVWLWGTSSEHSVLYNYQISNAKNVFMGAIQTETAYMQSAPDALNSGFTPNPAYQDPTFEDCTTERCKKTWGLRILDSEDIFMFGGGLYSFFDDYQQQCLDTEDCQEHMIELSCSKNIHLYGFVTKASTDQITVNGQAAVLEKDNPNLFGATVLVYEQQ